MQEKRNMKNDNTRPSSVVEEDGVLTSKYGSVITKHLTGVLSILSKNDALTIFLLANDGIKSELDTPSKLGLTKKQYYTRLRQLVDLGLLFKQDNSYHHTTIGRLVYQKHIVGLTNHIKNSKYFEMVDVLKTNPKFKDDDITKFISKLFSQASLELEESSQNISSVIYSYDEMVNKVLTMMELAQKEIILISRFTNELIINTMIKKANRGIEVKVLADLNLVQSFFEKAGPLKANDKNKKERITVVADPYYPTPISRKYAEVPFCVLVIDKKHVGVEIIDSYKPNKFKMAIFLSDSRLAHQMQALFDTLWAKASTNPPQIATK